MAYETPVGIAGDTVLLAHGFLRNLKTMRGWAGTGDGVTVTVMSLATRAYLPGAGETLPI